MISPQAIIEEGAVIGPGCVIEANAFIAKDAKLGSGCIIKQGARILGNTTLGENCTIYSYAVLGEVPQDLSYHGEESFLVLGPNCRVREFATINSGSSKGDNYTKIGANAFIMAYSHIAHDCILGQNVILANAATLAGHVQIGDYSVIGGMTPVHQFARIGDFCMLAGASALSQDLPHYCLAEGNRATVRSLNLVGLRRHLEKDDIAALSEAFRLIFRNETGPGLMSKAAKELLQSPLGANSYVARLCSFILETKRGIA